jgi:hypothetical protein
VAAVTGIARPQAFRVLDSRNKPAVSGTSSRKNPEFLEIDPRAYGARSSGFARFPMVELSWEGCSMATEAKSRWAISMGFEQPDTIQ